MKGKYFDKKRDEQISESMLLVPDLAVIKKESCNYYQIDVNTVLKPRRGMNNEARDMAIYLARRFCNMGLKDIGVEFGLKGYFSTGSVMERMDRLLQKDRRLKKRYGDIKEALIKGQSET
jgi:chromosomal replication initiation ATPase DnaA